MTEDQALALFHSCGAILDGHFQLTSGLHSSRYLQCALVLQYPHYCEQLCTALAEPFLDLGVETVIAPALGGIVVGYEVARRLGARSIFAERDASDVMSLRRGFSLQPGERTIVVEDVCTTGGSISQVIELIRAAGALVLGVGALVDRSAGKAGFDVPSFNILPLEVPTHLPDACPQCLLGGTAVKPGSRR